MDWRDDFMDFLLTFAHDAETCKVTLMFILQVIQPQWPKPVNTDGQGILSIPVYSTPGKKRVAHPSFPPKRPSAPFLIFFNFFRK
jgi:hypothetical protein